MGILDVVNVYGMIAAVVLFLPHVIYAKTHTYNLSVFSNRAMLYIARIGRFFSFFLMSFNIGVLEKGFTEPKDLMERFWLITIAILTLICVLLWIWFFQSSKKLPAYLILFISAAVVIFSGICQVKTLLFTAGIVYFVGELYLASRYFNHK